MKKFSLLFAASLTLLSFIQAVPTAEAITLTYSEKTKKVAPYFDFRANYDLPFNLNINGYAALAPDLSSFVTPLIPAGQSGDLASQIASYVKWDTLLDLNLNLGYKVNLFDLDLVLGHLNGSLMPYVGYRHMFTFTGDLSGGNTSSQNQGAHYGARFNLGLPLGFSAFAYAEASTLFGSSFERSGTSQSINPNNLTLPGYGIGANWTLPFINAASAYAGYRGFFLPADLRHGTPFSGKTELIHGLNFGLNFLFFGI